jgi:hypothetical protein
MIIKKKLEEIYWVKGRVPRKLGRNRVKPSGIASPHTHAPTHSLLTANCKPVLTLHPLSAAGDRNDLSFRTSLNCVASHTHTLSPLCKPITLHPPARCRIATILLFAFLFHFEFAPNLFPMSERLEM